MNWGEGKETAFRPARTPFLDGQLDHLFAKKNRRKHWVKVDSKIGAWEYIEMTEACGYFLLSEL